MVEINYMSEEGLEKLRKELQELKTKGRGQIASEIREAREKGDLAENAEYHAAKDAQALLELRISKLETTFSNARVFDSSNMDDSKVVILSKVKLENQATKEQFDYQIVSEEEADVKSGKISKDSPIGKGLLGKKKGSIIKVKAPSGTIQFKLISISF